MSSDNKTRKWNRIPIRFLDSENSDSDPNSSDEQFGGPDEPEMHEDEAINEDEDFAASEASDLTAGVEGESASAPAESGGPEIAELVATRAELKRVQGELADLKERLTRRQADFENYRKRTERERVENYNRAVAEIASKLLPVLDNLRRALDAESSVESQESDEFRHFLSGVDLIYKQLDGVIDALGVKPIPAVGEPFNPHFHEAVVSEATDEYEPETVIQEIVRGYRMGDKLIRPSLVKVAVKK